MSSSDELKVYEDESKQAVAEEWERLARETAGSGTAESGDEDAARRQGGEEALRKLADQEKVIDDEYRLALAEERAQLVKEQAERASRAACTSARGPSRCAAAP